MVPAAFWPPTNRASEQNNPTPTAMDGHNTSLVCDEFFKIMCLMWTDSRHVSIQAHLSCSGTNSLEHNINCPMSPTIIRSTLWSQHQSGTTVYFAGLKTETTCRVQILLQYMQQTSQQESLKHHLISCFSNLTSWKLISYPCNWKRSIYSISRWNIIMLSP